MPHMSWTNAAGKAAMRKGVVEMIVKIVRSCVMAYPTLSIDMRGVGMAGLVTVVTIGLRGMGCAVKGCRSPRGRGRWWRLMPSTFVLGKRRDRYNKQCCQN
jgi:hypothetical protein